MRKNIKISTIINPKKSFLLLFQILCLFLLSYSHLHSSLPAKYGGIIKFNLDVKNPSLDPAYAFLSEEILICNTLFEPLFYFTENDKVVLNLLSENPKISQDELIYSFKLKPDVFFHDNTPLTSSSVFNSFYRIITINSPYMWIFKDLNNFTIIDDNNFSIVLKRKNSNFLKYLSLPGAYITKSHSSGKYIIGTGPFILKEKTKNKISIENFSKHHSGRPYLDSIIFNLGKISNESIVDFKIKKTDLCFISPENVFYYIQNQLWQDYIYSTTAKNVISLIIDKNLLKNNHESFFYLISSNIDKNGIINVILNGIGEKVPEGKKFEFSKDSLTKVKKEVKNKNFTLYYTNSPQTLAIIAKKIQNDLSKVGIKIKLKKMDIFEMFFNDLKNTFYLFARPVYYEDDSFIFYFSHPRKENLEEIKICYYNNYFLSQPWIKNLFFFKPGIPNISSIWTRKNSTN